MSTDTDLLWSPSRSTAESSDIAGFMGRLSRTRGLSFSDYPDPWRWSTTDVPADGGREGESPHDSGSAVIGSSERRLTDRSPGRAPF
ncbi:hypothetical protein ACIQZB_35635 [Streptomyces sp. NPDC097727]|uniref:hypothetical protein n=1 Tax=Streptomyces sp. NPDC097727 TaxID=3366092 RepID=UPI0038261107